MAQLRVPYLGTLNVFSVHLSWWSDGFRNQFQRLCEWAGAEAANSGGTTLLCGDFNVAAGSAGYRYVAEAKQYEDQYLAANRPSLFEQIFRTNEPKWQEYPSDDGRIDYIFMGKGNALRVSSAKELFTERDYGRVSDHLGYLMTFEPR
jgi:maltose 6'-phosphate phosphatase